MPSDKTSKQKALLGLLVLGGVLAYTTFQWGGVVRTGRYQYLLVLGLLAMVLALTAAREEWLPIPSRAARWAVILLPAYVLLQVVPLPVSVLRALSPARAGAVDALGPAGAKMSFASLSVFPAGTFQYFLLVCGFLVIFLVIRELTLRFRRRRWFVVWPILIIAAIESGLGLWQYFGGAVEQVRWGTYANHNHFAGFLEMSLPFAVMYSATVLHRARSEWHSSVATALVASSLLALAVLIFSAIIFSFSRMGFISTLFSLLVMGILMLGTRQLNWLNVSRGRQWIAVGMVAALLLAVFIFLPPIKLIQRFGQLASAEGLVSDGRADLWRETIPLIKSYPVFGCGLGGYETAFSRFKISGVLVTDNFAHNDYLQFLSELGLAGFLIGGAIILPVVRMGLNCAVKSSNPEERYFAVACVGAMSAIALHSLADFNLYIPANAMLLAWIAGAAASVELQRNDMKPRKRTEVKIANPVEVAVAGSYY